jgi:hypothetical protein
VSVALSRLRTQCRSAILPVRCNTTPSLVTLLSHWPIDRPPISFTWQFFVPQLALGNGRLLLHLLCLTASCASPPAIKMGVFGTKTARTRWYHLVRVHAVRPRCLSWPSVPHRWCARLHPARSQQVTASHSNQEERKHAHFLRQRPSTVTHRRHCLHSDCFPRRRRYDRKIYPRCYP